ncbi:MAG: hypothetical protein GX567_13440 [Clostridia bacterium]|nr:hypothetical protein [Clostridia bacterium]
MIKTTDQKSHSIKISTGRPKPLGPGLVKQGVQLATVAALQKTDQFDLYLYHKGSARPELIIHMKEHLAMGDVYSVILEPFEPSGYEYQYILNGSVYSDRYAIGFNQYAGATKEEPMRRNQIVTADFDWENDEKPLLLMNQVVMYEVHTRGFTKHKDSGVSHKGTFQGMIEKIPYLKDLGINQIELLPAYEFEDTIDLNADQKEGKPDFSDSENQAIRMNYWGFSNAFYRVPKQKYAGKEDASAAFKNLVKAMHKENIEVIMQFYFPKDINPNDILYYLTYWVEEYHIDGIHLKGDHIPVEMIAADPMLSKTKIYYLDFDMEQIRCYQPNASFQNLALYNDGFMYDIRHFLKSDEDYVQAFLYRFKRLPSKTGIINYITEYQGFSLLDLVSYDYKHNETNMEENRDGNNYNHSWNCGVEGPSRKKAVLQLRKKQMMNALVFLILSQGTPMLHAGDEIANTQYGNNNPYCQDNETAWIKWKRNSFSNDIFLFTKQLIELRRAHPILHNAQELRIMDYISCGYPDLSYHADVPWRPRFDNHIRHVGLMLCGKYAVNEHRKEDCFFYFAVNMHWEIHEFQLPKLPKGSKWYLKVTTDEKAGAHFIEEERTALENQEKIIVPARSIMILKGL